MKWSSKGKMVIVNKTWNRKVLGAPCMSEKPTSGGTHKSITESENIINYSILPFLGSDLQ